MQHRLDIENSRLHLAAADHAQDPEHQDKDGERDRDNRENREKYRIGLHRLADQAVEVLALRK